MANQIETAQIKELSELIKKSEISKYEAQGVEFCNIWPNAKSALQTILGAVPGVSIFAGAAISIVIAAGNAASEAMCKK